MSLKAAIKSRCIILKLSMPHYRFNAWSFVVCLFCVWPVVPQDWQSIGGPEGGTVQSILLRGHYLFAGMRGGVYRLDLNGGNWSPPGAGMLTDWSILSMAQLGQTVLAGSETDGIYASTDDGASWVKVTSGLTQPRIKSLTSDSSGFYALSSNNSVFFLGKFDTSWTKIPLPVPAEGSSAMAAAIAVNGNYLYVAGGYPSYGIYRFVFNGTGWQVGSTLFPGKECTGLVADGADIYLSTDDTIYRSSDNGDLWESINEGLPPVSMIRFISTVNNRLYTSDFSGQIYSLSRNGSAWIQVSTKLPAGFWPFCLTGEGNRLFVGSQDDGVLTSTDAGVTWSSLNPGLCRRRIFDVAVNGGQVVANSEFGRLFESDIAGPSWRQIDPARLANSKIRCLVSHKSSIFAGTWGEGVFRSDDDGRTWNAVNNFLTNSFFVSLSSADSTLYAGSTDNVFQSTDNGARWIKSLTGIAENSYVRGVCKVGTTLFAATSDSVFRSSDNGANWKCRSSGIQANAIWSIAALGTSVFVGTWQGIFKTENLGDLWNRSDFGVPYNQVYTVIPYQGLLFAGTDNGGVFVSADTGRSWNPVGSAILPSTNCVENLAAADGYLYAATQLASVQRYPIGNLKARLPGVGIHAPASFSATLNPAGMKTLDVQYTLSESGPVKFQIVDFQGRKKSEVVWKMVPIGRHTFSYCTRTLSTGLYCARVITVNGMQSGTFLMHQ